MMACLMVGGWKSGVGTFAPHPLFRYARRLSRAFQRLRSVNIPGPISELEYNMNPVHLQFFWGAVTLIYGHPLFMEGRFRPIYGAEPRLLDVWS